MGRASRRPSSRRRTPGRPVARRRPLQASLGRGFLAGPPEPAVPRPPRAQPPPRLPPHPREPCPRRPGEPGQSPSPPPTRRSPCGKKARPPSRSTVRPRLAKAASPYPPPARRSRSRTLKLSFPPPTSRERPLPSNTSTAPSSRWACWSCSSWSVASGPGQRSSPCRWPSWSPARSSSRGATSRSSTWKAASCVRSWWKTARTSRPDRYLPGSTTPSPGRGSRGSTPATRACGCGRRGSSRSGTGPTPSRFPRRSSR